MTIAQRFLDGGLTTQAYLKAALKKPQLFTQRPATVASNILRVVEHFPVDGLTLHDYLRAAVMQPPLFSQSPATIIRHVKLITSLHHQGFVTFPGEATAPPAYPQKPMIDYLVRKPMLFCLSDDNFALREACARVAGKRPTGTSLLTRPRRQVEKDLLAARSKLD